MNHESITDKALDFLREMFPNKNIQNAVVTENAVYFNEGGSISDIDSEYDVLHLNKVGLGRYKHLNRNTHYNANYIGILQVNPSTILRDGDRMVVYFGEEDGGMCWIRELKEFHDGRFSPEINIPKPNISVPEYFKNYLEEKLGLLKQEISTDLRNVAENIGYNISGDLIRKLVTSETSHLLIYLDESEKVAERDSEIAGLNGSYTGGLVASSTLTTLRGVRKALDADLSSSSVGRFITDRVKKEYPDEIFDKMLREINYVIRRHNNCDDDEDFECVKETALSRILSIASNYGDGK